MAKPIFLPIATPWWEEPLAQSPRDERRTPPRKWWETGKVERKAPWGRHTPATVFQPYGVWNGRASFPAASAVGDVLPSLRDFKQNLRNRNLSTAGMDHGGVPPGFAR
jgi:hypothetical protein